jgi:hypothetical protein
MATLTLSSYYAARAPREMSVLMPNFARLTTLAFVLLVVTRQMLERCADLIYCVCRLAIDEIDTEQISSKIVCRNRHKLRCLQADDMQYPWPVKQLFALVYALALGTEGVMLSRLNVISFPFLAGWARTGWQWRRSCARAYLRATCRCCADWCPRARRPTRATMTSALPCTSPPPKATPLRCGRCIITFLGVQ